jgi:hypothetical protein
MRVVTAAEISKKCPWFFEMRELIGQRPNLVPTGLGHSSTPVASGVILPEETSANEDEKDDTDNHSVSSIPYDDWEHTPGHTPEPEARKRTFNDMEDDGAAVGSGDDYGPSSDIADSAPHIPTPDNDSDDDMGLEHAQDTADDNNDGDEPKAKSKGRKTHRKTFAKPGTSKPAVPAPAAAPKLTKRTKVAEFAEIAKEDERTRQKELDLATLRTRQQMKATESRGRYLEKREERKREEKKGKREKELAKLRIKELKLIQSHERHMQAARPDLQSSTSHAASFFGSRSSHASSNSSRYAASEPDYTDLDSFAGNAVAGPSTSQLDYSNFDFNSLPNSFGDGS